MMCAWNLAELQMHAVQYEHLITCSVEDKGHARNASAIVMTDPKLLNIGLA
jgi:hypothetical protein